MDIGAIGGAIAGSIGTGIVSALGTLKGVGVHLSYVKEQLTDLKNAVVRAHTRLDENDRRVDDLQRRIQYLEKQMDNMRADP